MANNHLTFPHDDARRVLWLRALEMQGQATTWGDDDRAWATTRAVEADAATAAGFLIDRARHAWQRLGERAPPPEQPLMSLGRAHSAWLAAAVGLAGGALADQVGSAQHVHVLLAPGWALLLWHLLLAVGWLALWLYRLLHRASLAAASQARPAERWLARLVSRRATRVESDAEQAFARDWRLASAPLLAPRVAAALHAAATGLALGVVLSLYARGLVTDYRVGWQSTFLEAGAVQSFVNLLFAPASALSGIAVPEVAALRVAAGQAPQGLAAPWLHLQALTLLLWVALPRAALAVVASLRGRHLAQGLQLPLHEAYFQQLLAAWPAGQRRPVALVFMSGQGAVDGAGGAGGADGAGGAAAHGAAGRAASAWLPLLQAQAELRLSCSAPPSAELVQALQQADAQAARQGWLAGWRQPRAAPEHAPWLALREQAELLLLTSGAFALPGDQAEFLRWWAKPVWVLDGPPPLPWWPLEQAVWRRLQQQLAVSRRVPLVKLMARRQTALESALEAAIESLADELAQQALQHLQPQPQLRAQEVHGEAVAVPARRVHEARAGVLGGVVSGAMAGLGADLASGGLTMGGGALVGGLVGALGAAGAAKQWNRRHAAPTATAMAAEQLQQLAREGLLRLVQQLHAACAGAADERGGADESTRAAWSTQVHAQIHAQQQRHAAAWHALWNSRPLAPAELQRALAPLLASCLENTLHALHPGSHLGLHPD